MEGPLLDAVRHAGYLVRRVPPGTDPCTPAGRPGARALVAGAPQWAGCPRRGDPPAAPVLPVVLVVDPRRSPAPPWPGPPVFGYLVPHSTPEHVAATLEAAAALAAYVSGLQGEVSQLAARLEERKLVDRAKGLLMAGLGLTEEQAYQRLRRQSMQTRRPLGRIAAETIRVMAPA